MTFPRWLDPTPLTRAFVSGFADLPIREPFYKQKLTGETFVRAAQISNAARKKAVLDELARTGETMLQRTRRLQAASKRALRVKYWQEREAAVVPKL